MRTLKQSTAANVMLLMVDSTDHVTGKTGLTLTVTASKDGAAFASISPTVTERGNGWYSIALTTAHTDTLGDLVLRATGTAADPAERTFVVAARVNDDLAFPVVSGRGIDVDATGGVEVGSIVANAITAASIAASALNGKGDWNIGKTGYSLTATTGLGNQTANITGSVTSVTNAVTVGTINANVITAASIAAAALNGKGDWNIGKTGYSLTQAFPANFASMAITVGGAVTAGTVSDKTGYSLTQSFPANFASMAITVGGAVTAGTVSDKTGYSLTAGTGLGNQTADITGSITSVTNAITLPSIPANWITAAGINAAALNGKGDWNIGKTGYSLTATTGLGNQTANITGNLSGSVGSVTGLTAANLDVAVSTRLATAGYTAPDNATIAVIQKLLRNKRTLDPSTGAMTFYDDDNTTPLFTATAYDDVAGSTTYSGTNPPHRVNRLV